MSSGVDSDVGEERLQATSERLDKLTAGISVENKSDNRQNNFSVSVDQKPQSSSSSGSLNSFCGQKTNTSSCEVDKDSWKVTPAKSLNTDDSDTQMTPSSQWKDIFNMTPGNFSRGLKKKDVKFSYNTPRKGFLQESSQQKKESDNTQLIETQLRNQDRTHIRRLTFDDSRDNGSSTVVPDESQAVDPRRAQGKGKGHLKVQGKG